MTIWMGGQGNPFYHAQCNSLRCQWVYCLIQMMQIWIVECILSGLCSRRVYLKRFKLLMTKSKKIQTDLRVYLKRECILTQFILSGLQCISMVIRTTLSYCYRPFTRLHYLDNNFLADTQKLHCDTTLRL